MENNLSAPSINGGLTKSEVEKKLKKFGLNVLPEKKPPSKLSIFLDQFKNPLVYVLLGASIVTFLIGDVGDAIIIMMAVMMDAVLGFVQENKTSNALEALKKVISQKAIVYRDNQMVEIDTKEIVPGDIVFLKQGDKIPADEILVSVNRFHVNEAVLTGESMPLEKKVNEKVYMGTIAAAGQAVMKVEETGARTQIGKIAERIQEKEDITPFQKQLKIFSRQLLMIVGVIITTVLIVGILRGISLSEIFITSVALAVSSIPEGLLVSLTIVLTVGMKRILDQKGLVRKLSAAETLGGVTVICADKTGTLTEGNMQVSDFVGNENLLYQQAFLANDLDDPIVIAAYKWAKDFSKNIDRSKERLDSIPFSSQERFSIYLYKWDNKKNMIFVNGAPEMLLNWSTLSKEERDKIMQTIENLTSQGKRVLGFAKKEVPADKKIVDVSDAKGNLDWVGILAFSDPVREGLKDVLKETTDAGIRTIVITGDFPNTSIYVLSQLGIEVKNDEYLTGEQLAKMPVEELKEVISKVKLFARTTPDQKLSIVEALKSNEEVVAMVGDGVNDAPALHRADIGIVVDNASDVAKESADLILLDSSFATIVHAIEEGRAMFENIRKIILYLLCDAFEEIIIVLAGMIFNLPLPITAVQILWINLVSDGFPDVALTVDPKRRGIMKDKPRSPKESLITGWMFNQIAFVSILAGALAFAYFYVVYRNTGNIALARSATFATIGINSLIYVFSVRAPTVPFFKTRVFKNKWLNLSVIGGIILQAVPFLSPSLREFFKLEVLPINYWLISFGLSLIIFLCIEIFKHVYHSKIVPAQNKTP